jgi:hypothetical protein
VLTRLLRFSKLLVLLGVACAGILVYAPKAHAVTASDWRAGHIIDDSIFFNKDSMNVAQIQAFLDAKVPTCNRSHATTNASFPPPYTCLKEYQENTTTHENNIGRFNSDGSPYNVPGGISAAQIIWNTSQSYGINPQVLIVLLQKEQSLVTDDWPWPTQYQKATGYACPDTAPCDSKYYGFFNQVDNAAWQFRQYGINPGGYLYQAAVTRYVGYSPDGSCGGSNVFIENQATADLYNYTPYQPNAGALAAGWGSANCGAYGNRNFWLYFNNWFGSTSAGDTQAQVVSDLQISPSSLAMASDSITASFTIRNNTATPVYVGGMSVAVRRASDGANFDYPLVNITVPAYGTYVYSQSQTLAQGTYSFDIANYRQGVGWSGNYPYPLYDSLKRNVSNYVVSPAAALSSGLSLSTTAIVPGKNVTASFQVTNPSASPINLGLMAVAVRDPAGRIVDYPADNNVIIQPGATYTYTKTQAFSALGSYGFQIVNYRTGIGWNVTTPGGAGTRALTATVKQNPRVVSSLSLSPASPIAGQNVTATYQIRNDADTAVTVGLMAVAVRGPQGQNYDYAPDTNVTIAPNSTYTYSATQTFPGSGQYGFQIVNYRSDFGWNTNYPVLDSGVAGSASLQVGNNPAISSSLSLSPANPVAGQNVTASFQVTNNADVSMNVGLLAVAVRGPQGQNLDYAPDDNVTIAPHTTYTYTKTQALPQAGQYRFDVVNYRPGFGWTTTYPASANGGVLRTVTQTVGNNPQIVTSVSTSPANPVAGQNVTASFQVRNDSEVAVNIGLMAVAVRGPQGQNLDYAPDNNVTIQPHATYTYSASQIFTQAGAYNLTIVNYRPSVGWTTTYPSRATGTLSTSILTVSP